MSSIIDFIHSSLPTIYFILQQSLYFTIPLLVVALGGMFSERSGVVNIALEGIMLFGAFFGILVIHIIQGNIAEHHIQLLSNISYGQLILLIGLVVAGIAGLLFSLFHAYASVNMKADQVISGTALNLFAPAIAIFLARSLTTTNHLQQVSFVQSQFFIRKVPVLGDIPFIGDIFFKQTYLTTFIGILILIVSSIVLFKTRFGLRLRSCGEHPHAADAAGINVYKTRYFGVMISGFLGGIGGYTLIVTTATQLNATVYGYGFLALAVLIFGQWKPSKILMAAAFFGLATAVASGYSSITFLDKLSLPSQFYKMLPFIVTIIALAFTSKNSQGPRAAGEVYDAGKR